MSEEYGNKSFSFLSLAAIIIAVVALALGSVLPQSDDLLIGQLGDTQIVGPVDGQVLKYDSASGRWMNLNESDVELNYYSLANLTDSAIVSPVDGQLLSYEGASGKWVNVAAPVVPMVKAGVSDVFNLSVASEVSMNLTFSGGAFTGVPVVSVGLLGVSNSSAVVVNVDAVNVTSTGFVARCSIISAADGEGRFSYVAVKP